MSTSPSKSLLPLQGEGGSPLQGAGGAAAGGSPASEGRQVRWPSPLGAGGAGGAGGLNFLFAWRYFKAKKSTNAINIIAWVSVTAIAVGAASLIIILSAFKIGRAHV